MGNSKTLKSGSKGACALVFAGAVLTGCVSMAPDRQNPSVVSDLPDSFDPARALEQGQYTPANWWRSFEDPVLDGLVSDALARNLDIAESAARLRQASAQARVARAALIPTLNATGDASSTSTPIDGLPFGDFGGGIIDRIDNEVYSLGLGAAYELDLFGRARDDYRAGRRDAIASAQDLKTVQLTTAAETIAAYFDYVDLKRQIELTAQTAEVLEDRAVRTDERYARGLVDSLELYQIRQDLRSTQSSLPQLRSSLAANRARLALLLGTYPEALDERLSQTLQPRLVFDPIPAGLPSDLLTQRPDVAAAWARLDAARLRIGARRAERFPSLSLTASIGTQGGDLSSAFDFANNWASSLASSIVAPIFDAGRINANIASARATYDQQAAAYARSVIAAYGEVDQAFADYEQQRARYALVSQQHADAQSSLDLQKRRFEVGVGGYLAYLDALRNLYQVEIALSSAARATALARLGVHRALGGDWASEIEPEPLEMQSINETEKAP